MAALENTVIIGGKGSSLSSEAITTISNSLSKVQIDSSTLDKLSQSKNHSFISFSFPNTPPNPQFLTLEESRAILALLLNKLVLADSQIRPNLPVLICQALNHGFSGSFPIKASVSGYLQEILELNGKTLEEIRVTEEEIEVFDSCNADLIGIGGLLDSLSSKLCTIADAVAALSCEALQADDRVFDLPIAADGSSHKDRTDVASDMRMLLFGSKRVGGWKDKNSERYYSAFGSIASGHGGLRWVTRLVHARMRVELNGRVSGKRRSDCEIERRDFVSAVLPLAVCLESLGGSSLIRAKLSIGSIDDNDLVSHLYEIFDRTLCLGVGKSLDDMVMRAYVERNYAATLHEIYLLLLKVRDVLAWEAYMALFLLGIHEKSVSGEGDEKTQVGKLPGKSGGDIANGGNMDAGAGGSKARGKAEKKKKGALGKGTSTIKQLIEERLHKYDKSVDGAVLVADNARKLASFFDPKDTGLDSLLMKVKEIVESNEVRRLPKIPKGTRDFGKEQMAIRERAFSTIVKVFKRHGAVALDTPVFELRETLMGKYGDDTKLIFDLADQGGEICSLRYDLTVPFARYVAMNNISALKRYQIAKVYRRDNPSKGRYREFYQCDFDIAGQYEPMEPDFEVIRVLTELLDELNIGDYEIKLNHRKLLDGMLEICGVPPEKFRTVCSSIDKLDKLPFEQVRKELVEAKGLSLETTEKIGSFLKRRGSPLEVLFELKQEGSQFLKNDGSLAAMNDLEILFKALDKSKSIGKVVFDLSLARGLDYYTGVIYEAVFKGATQVGSIAAGGRYDNLVGMFSGKQVPAVGVSLGIERVFTIMEQLEKDRNQVIRATETQVLVASLGKDLGQAAGLVGELWNAEVQAEFTLNKKVMKMIDRAKQLGIPWMLIEGENEVQKGVVILKDIEANKQEEIPRDKIVEELQRKLNTTTQSRYAIV